MEVYTTLLGVRSQLEEILKQSIKEDDNTLKEQLNSIKRCIDEMSPELAYNIYDRCERIKLDFDFLKNNFSDSLNIEVPENLTNRKRLTVFLMGEFSSGKTTFIQRSLGQKAGGISARPTTGFLTIHKVGNDESLEIVFSDKFEVDKTAEFEVFLQNYHLNNYINRRGKKWELIEMGRKTLGPEFSVTDFMNFLNKANDFPECFKEITWTHKKIGKNSSFFDFADIYDMPGSGAGNEKHDENIDYAFKTYTPDIIFYFVDSNQSIPSSEGHELIKKRVLPIINKQEGNVPSLFFVYEIPVENADELVRLNDNGKVEFNKDFLKIKADALGDYITKKHTNENDFEFETNEKEKLLEARLLDLRGPKNSVSERLHNALSLSLQAYYLNKSKKAIVEITEGLNKFENEIENKEIIKMVLSEMEDTDDTDINTYLKSIFDEIKQKTDIGKNLSIEDAKEIFKKHFYLNSDENPGGSYNNNSFSEALLRRYKKINQVIDDIIKQFSKIDKTDDVKDDFVNEQIELSSTEKKSKANELKVVASKIGEKLKSQVEEIRNPKKCISYQKIVDGFQKSYKENVEWQDLPFMVQSYYALKLSESDDIKNYYLLSTASAFISRISNDIESLESLRTEVPFCSMPLRDFVNNS